MYICVCTLRDRHIYKQTTEHIAMLENTPVCLWTSCSLLLSLRYQVSLFTVCLIQDLEFLKSSKTLSCDWRLISRKSGRGSRKGQFSRFQLSPSRIQNERDEANMKSLIFCLSVEPGMRPKGKSSAWCRVHLSSTFLPLFKGLLTWDFSHRSGISASRMSVLPVASLSSEGS